MKTRIRILLLSFALLLNQGYIFSQKIEVDISACTGIYNLFTSIKNGASKQVVSSMLDSLFLTQPYQVMFKHYNRSWRPDHLPPDVFKRMILSLKFGGSYSTGENQRADSMLPFWTKAYNNLSLFSQNLEQMKNTDLKTLINNGVIFAQSWLPDDWHIPDFYIPIHPNGGSRAFAIGTAQGYDFFQLPRDSAGNIQWNELIGTISHESHHLGIRTIYPDQLSSPDSTAYLFLSFFVGEGTATKLINNYPGGRVPVIDSLRPTTAFYSDKEVVKWWQKYTNEESDLFKHFIETLEQVCSGKLSEKELMNEISKFWLAGYVSPVYFIGAELFGAIYLGYGKIGVFTAMHDPRQMLFLYINAIKSKPELLNKCFLIPDSVVQKALVIGTVKKQ